MRLGIIELFDEERKFLDRMLEELVIGTLKFSPLEEIFNLNYIRDIKKNGNSFETELEILKIKLEEGLHTICVVNENILPHALGAIEDTDSIVYTDLDPKTLAHELGHNLGLKHISEICTYFPLFYDNCPIKNRCLSLGYVMCGQADAREETKGFQKNELKILNKYIATELV